MSSEEINSYIAKLERENAKLKARFAKLFTKNSILKRKYQIALLALVKLSKYEPARKAMEQCVEWDEKLKAQKFKP